MREQLALMRAEIRLQTVQFLDMTVVNAENFRTVGAKLVAKPAQRGVGELVMMSILAPLLSRQAEDRRS